MKDLIIRNETEKDYRAVEELTREAFWNVYKPGADEHYYVHMMRNHPDFIPELAFVLEKEGEIIKIRVQGNGFLYNMVRIIAGTLIEVGAGKREPQEIPVILEKCDRCAAGPTAPAHGLTMIGIDYEPCQ